MSIPTSLQLPFAVLESVAETSAASDSALDLTRYLLISAAMVAVIGGLGWFFQRTMAASLRSRAEKRALRIVDVLPMGGKRKLAVVKVYDRTFVVGLGDKEISLISELDGAVEEREQLAPRGSQTKSNNTPSNRAKPGPAKGVGLARAFEAIRSRVGEGKPKPQPKIRAPKAESSLAATLNRVARSNGTAPTITAQRAPGRAGLGDGRGLLG